MGAVRERNNTLERSINTIENGFLCDWHTVYGLDASLRHGSLVQVHHPTSEAYSWKLIYEWDKKGPSLGEKATLQEMAEFSLHLVEVLLQNVRGPVLVEFDPRSVYWRSGKRQIVTMAMFLGYLVAALHAVGYPATLVTPEECRRFFGFTKGKKEEFHDHFLMLSKAYSMDYANLVALRGTDQLDALMIGMMYFPSIELR